jgi:molybdopterin-synthase adenylyltransferase
MKTSEESAIRYSRQLLLKEVGNHGQERLRASRVLIIGVGGLGSPAAIYLAAAGVGTIGIVDSDVVELSNLNRQIMYHSGDLSGRKVTLAAQKLRAINPDISVRQYPTRAEASNLSSLVVDYDFVIDGTDNFSSKFLINDACVLHRKPFSHAGVLGFTGQTITVLPGQSACVRCIFGEPPPPDSVPSTATVGVFGAVPGVIGTIQAIEAMKQVLGRSELLTDTLLTWDALRMTFRKVAIKRNLRCPVCGEHPSIVTL